MAHRRSVDRALLRVSDAADALALSRATVYGLMARGTLRAVHIGASRRVPVKAIDEFVRAREREAAALEKKSSPTSLRPVEDEREAAGECGRPVPAA